MYQYSCLSHETGKKCIYSVFLFDKKKDNVSEEKLEELEEILYEFTSSSYTGEHLSNCIDYMIKFSKTMVKVELVSEYKSKPIKSLDGYELAVFFYNIRRNLKDLIIGLCYLKSRFIGDARWLRIGNLGFNSISNNIVLSNYINIDLRQKKKKGTLKPIKEVVGNDFLSGTNSNSNEQESIHSFFIEEIVDFPHFENQFRVYTLENWDYQDII